MCHEPFPLSCLSAYSTVVFLVHSRARRNRPPGEQSGARCCSINNVCPRVHAQRPRPSLRISNERIQRRVRRGIANSGGACMISVSQCYFRHSVNDIDVNFIDTFSASYTAHKWELDIRLSVILKMWINAREQRFSHPEMIKHNAADRCFQDTRSLHCFTENYAGLSFRRLFLW